MSKNKKNISAEEFDRIFDEGKEDITQYLDMGSARRINKKPEETQTRRINVDFPEWMIERMDKEADQIGVTRQALIKFVINQHLTQNRQHGA